MAQNLKRKRGQQKSIRKSPEQDEEEHITSEASLEVDAMDEIGDPEDEPSAELEDDEWEGVGVSGTGVQPHIPEEPKQSNKPRKPPTGEELRTIRDAGELYRSGSFKLQIDALLPNVRPKSSRIAPLEKALFSLHTLLGSLPPIPPKHPLDASRELLKQGIAVPYPLPQPTKDTNWKVSFEPPSDISLVGSYANKISVKGKDGMKFGVDVAVEMPDDLFQEKDYLDGRFFHKRAFFLATIASVLKSQTNFGVGYSASGDPRLTILVLSSCSDNSANDFTKLDAQIHIIPVLSRNTRLPINRLSPSHSNIRISAPSDADESTTPPPPTPLYNTALHRCLTPKSDLLATHTMKEMAPAFGDAVTLLRVWANQRGYGFGTRMCVRGFEARGPWWSAVLAFMIAGAEPLEAKSLKGGRRRPLGKGLSSYQLFRAALDFLARHDFEREPVFLKSSEGHRFTPEEYSSHSGVVFIDASSSVNILADVPLGSLELLRHDALKTLDVLDRKLASSDPFSEVFLKEQRDLLTRFDTVIRVDLSHAKLRNFSTFATVEHGSSGNYLLASLATLLRKGLGNRSKAVAILHPTSSEPRNISQADSPTPNIIQIGLILDLEHAYRLVDHGPAADDPDPTVAQRFRDFWGEKAELRRFKDGRILESVVWDVRTSDERAHIPAMVVRHVLKQHFGVGEDATHTSQPGFDGMIRLPEVVSKTYQVAGVAAGFKGAIAAFDDLAKRIKALDDDFPLAIMSISPASGYLRYTSVFTPIPAVASSTNTLRYLPTMEIVLEFEKSSRWPNDLSAIQTIKLAFFERMATALMRANNGLKATVVVGDGVDESEIQDRSRLEIVTLDGWGFSARIWHERESLLLQQIIDDKRGLPHVKKVKVVEEGRGRVLAQALQAQEVYDRRFLHTPRHHRAVTALCHRYSAYSGTVRLVKRWLAAHWLLGTHITEEAVEILCAHFFVRDADGEAATEHRQEPWLPGSKERGFAVVVEFLMNWEWENGLFVALYGNEQAPKEGRALVTRKGASTGSWRLSTEADMDGHVWTAHGPDAVVTHRVRALSKATWIHLQEMERSTPDVKAIFTHPTTDYDFLIYLDPHVLPRYHQQVNPDHDVLVGRRDKGRYANIREEEELSISRPGFDAAQLLVNDLKRVFKDTFKVFYDCFGGDLIGGVWDPTLSNPRPFRVLASFSSLPNVVERNKKEREAANLVVLNKNAVLSDCKRLGNSLIVKISQKDI